MGANTVYVEVLALFKTVISEKELDMAMNCKFKLILCTSNFRAFVFLCYFRGVISKDKLAKFIEFRKYVKIA